MRGLFGRKKCLHRNAVIDVFLDETENEQKFKCLDHIFKCPECSRDFDALLEIWRKDRELISAAADVPLNQKEKGRIQKMASRELKKMKSGNGKTGIFTPSFPKIIVAAAGIMVAALMSWFLFQSPEEISLERKVQNRFFDVIQPLGLVDNDAVVFNWDSIKGARSYTLEILDRGLEPVYRRQEISRNRFRLPDEVFSRFKKGQIYFWKVSAEMGSNQNIESEFGKFVIPDKVP